MRKKEAGLTKGLMKRLILTSLCVLIVTGTSFGDWVTPKWVQLPNETSYGMDVRMDRNDGVERTLADDFLCTSTDKISDIHFWGSWKNDAEGEITKIHLSIHSDIPAVQLPYSMPGEQQWAMDFDSSQFTKRLYKDISPSYERWWDPYVEQSYQRQGDQKIWQYNINIDPSLAFEQQGTAENPKIYWLDIYVETADGKGEFGWKTSSQHWNDDAVSHVSIPTGQAGISWSELSYPYSTPPWQGNSVDFAFVVTPEPGTILLLGTGLLTVISRRRRFNNMAQRRTNHVFWGNK